MDGRRYAGHTVGQGRGQANIGQGKVWYENRRGTVEIRTVRVKQGNQFDREGVAS